MATIDLTKDSDDEQAPAPQQPQRDDDEAASLALARQLQAEEDAAPPPRRVDERPAKRPRSGPRIERVHAAGNGGELVRGEGQRGIRDVEVGNVCTVTVIKEI